MGEKTKKPVGVTGVDTKMVVDIYANQNSIRIFCNSLMVKDSHKDAGIQLKNSVLKQAKMVAIFQRNNINDTAKRVAINKPFVRKISAIYKKILWLTTKNVNLDYL